MPLWKGGPPPLGGQKTGTDPVLLVLMLGARFRRTCDQFRKGGMTNLIPSADPKISLPPRSQSHKGGRIVAGWYHQISARDSRHPRVACIER